MKRIFVAMSVVVCIGVIAGFAATNVVSVNVVGYMKATVPSNGFALVSYPLNPISGSNTLADLDRAQLPVGAKVWVWDRTAKGYIYSSKSRGGWSSNAVIQRGDAFWVTVPDPIATGDYELVLLGEVPDPVIDNSTSVDNISGIDAIGNPYPSEMLWTNSILAKLAPIPSRLWIWNGVSYNNYPKTRSGWTGLPADFRIQPGMGFWFETGSTNWSEPVPYSF